MFELCPPAVLDCRVNNNVLLLIQMVVTVMLLWDDSGSLDLTHETDQVGPSYCTGSSIPVLNLMNGVVWDELLRLSRESVGLMFCRNETYGCEILLGDNVMIMLEGQSDLRLDVL